MLSPLLLTDRKTGGRGRPRSASDRHAAEACLFRYYHSLAPQYRAFGWNQLPKKSKVSAATANRRFREWNEEGTWVAFWHRFRKLRLARIGLQKVESPVKALLREFERAYAFFNAHLFDNVLPATVLITVELSRRFLGQFRADAGGRFWIAISTRALNGDVEESLHALLHEMVHLRNRHVGLPDCHYGYHNRHFRDSAALVGLACKQGEYGYAVTIPNERARKVFARFRPKEVFTWPWGKTSTAAP